MCRGANDDGDEGDDGGEDNDDGDDVEDCAGTVIERSSFQAHDGDTRHAGNSPSVMTPESFTVRARLSPWVRLIEPTFQSGLTMAVTVPERLWGLCSFGASRYRRTRSLPLTARAASIFGYQTVNVLVAFDRVHPPRPRSDVDRGGVDPAEHGRLLSVSDSLDRAPVCLVRRAGSPHR